jgi:hypothetical protein
MIPLNKAKFCCQCDVIFMEERICPVCGEQQGIIYLSKWIAPLSRISKEVCNGKEKAA